jgi:hypothetical protein
MYVRIPGISSLSYGSGFPFTFEAIVDSVLERIDLTVSTSVLREHAP